MACARPRQNDWWNRDTCLRCGVPEHPCASPVHSESVGILRRIPQRGKVAAVIMLRVISSFAAVMKLSHFIVLAARGAGDCRATRERVATR